MDLNKAAEEIRAAVGAAKGKRILHVTDQHNRLSGFRIAQLLSERLEPDVLVNTGDISGWGPLVEGVWIRGFCRVRVPTVFAPGNHESRDASGHFQAVGACSLDEPSVCEVGGLRFWGYRDPNRSPLLGKPYDLGKCLAARERLWPPSVELPFIAAVHNRAMVGAMRGVPLVLSGHYHSPRVSRQGPTVSVRAGSTGGGGPFGGPLELAIIDVDGVRHEPLAVWLVSVGEAATYVKGVAG
ncbi:MAG: metallophosphoesterase [Actinomycetota bacterium]|nr:metallophosphoesterase [Actinomycetota bacterium]